MCSKCLPPERVHASERLLRRPLHVRPVAYLGGGAMMRPPTPFGLTVNFWDNFCSIFVSFVSRLKRKFRACHNASSDCPCMFYACLVFTLRQTQNAHRLIVLGIPSPILSLSAPTLPLPPLFIEILNIMPLRPRAFSETVVHGVRQSCFFVEPGVKISGVYYRDVLLTQKLLPVIRQISGNEFVCQQDSAPAHRTRETIEILRRETRRTLFHRNSGHRTVQILTRWITKSRLQCSSASTRQRFEMLTNCDSVC